MEAAVAVGTFIRIKANKSYHNRSLMLRRHHHHHHQVLGCNSKPGALHCNLKMGGFLTEWVPKQSKSSSASCYCCNIVQAFVALEVCCKFVNNG